MCKYRTISFSKIQPGRFSEKKIKIDKKISQGNKISEKIPSHLDHSIVFLSFL